MTRRFEPTPLEPLVDQLAAAFFHAPMGIALVAADGGFVRVNPALCALAGRSEDELLGLRWQELIHPRELAAVARALGDEGGFDAELRIRRADGFGVWVRATARALDDAGEGGPSLVVHIEDVTARRAGERQVALLAAVVASVADAVVVADPDGRILFLNAAAEALYGVHSAELEGRPVVESLVDPEASGGSSAWAPGAGVATHRRADGTRFEAEVKPSPVHGDDGALLGSAFVVRDVTARLAHDASAATLAAVVDAAAEGIVGIDEHDVVRFFSPAAERIFGWTAAEVIGGTAWRLVSEQRQLEARDLGAQLRAGRSVQRETVVRRKGGAHVAVTVTASPIRSPDGRYQGAAMTVLDLSERRRAQREVERTRELLQRVVDQAPNVIIWFKDRDGRCRLVNREGAALFGLEPADLLGRTDADLFPAAIAERNRAEDAEVLAAGEPLTFEKELPLGGAETLPFVVTKFPIPGENGRPDGVGVVASDISDLRRGEADRARLGAIVQAASDAIISKDRDGRITTWNPGAERIFGLSGEEALGLRCEDVVVAPAERERFRLMTARVLAGETVMTRMNGLRADGTVFPTEVSAAPLHDAGGATTGVVAIVRDISELIDAELELRERAAQLERSNADLERFAYAASHDLQEPLRSIKLGAETVMRAAADRLEDDERSLLAHVEAAATRMSAQVGALMQVARVALGQVPGEPVPVRLALEDALNALRAAIRESGAQIQIQEPLPAAAAPRAELALVLQNLLANAIKFARADTPPRIRVAGALRDGCVEVRIADNGVGLSESGRAHIFGIFGRAQQGVPGTGMGLAVCRRILERRGGSIAASSAGLDRGTEFVLRLPAAPAA